SCRCVWDPPHTGPNNDAEYHTSARCQPSTASERAKQFVVLKANRPAQLLRGRVQERDREQRGSRYSLPAPMGCYSYAEFRLSPDKPGGAAYSRGICKERHRSSLNSLTSDSREQVRWAVEMVSRSQATVSFRVPPYRVSSILLFARRSSSPAIGVTCFRARP